MIFVAPATRPLTVVHVAEDGADIDASRGLTALTRCGLPMVDIEVWIEVEPRDGDRICVGCVMSEPRTPRRHGRQLELVP